jgi:hypothetical protein
VVEPAKAGPTYEQLYVGGAFRRPLTAGEETVIPLDLSISFADVPALSRSIGRLATGGTAAYQLDGTVGIEAGRFGTPTFGPMTLTTGQLQVR